MRFSPGCTDNGCGCGPVSCTIFQDNFRRANAPNPGGAWTVNSGSVPIVNEELSITTGKVTPVAYNVEADPQTVMSFNLKGTTGSHCIIKLGSFTVDCTVDGCFQILGGCQPYQRSGPTAGTYFGFKMCYGFKTVNGVVDTSHRRLYVGIGTDEYQIEVPVQASAIPSIEVTGGSMQFNSFTLQYHRQAAAHQDCPYCETFRACIYFGDTQNRTLSAVKVPPNCDWTVLAGSFLQNNGGIYCSTPNSRIQINVPQPFCESQFRYHAKVLDVPLGNELKFFVGDASITFFSEDEGGSGKISLSSMGNPDHCIWFGSGGFHGTATPTTFVSLEAVVNYLSTEPDGSHLNVDGVGVGHQYLQRDGGSGSASLFVGFGTGNKVDGEIHFREILVSEQKTYGITGGFGCTEWHPKHGGGNTCFQDFNKPNLILGERWNSTGFISDPIPFGGGVSAAVSRSAGTLTWKGETTYGGQIGLEIQFQLYAPGDEISINMGGHTWRLVRIAPAFPWVIELYCDGVLFHAGGYGAPFPCRSDEFNMHTAVIGIACNGANWITFQEFYWNGDPFISCFGPVPGVEPNVIAPLGPTDYSTCSITATCSGIGDSKAAIGYIKIGEGNDNGGVCP